MGKVLVTGAAGFIGSHVCEALLDRGDAVIGIDDLNDFYDPRIKRRNLSLLRSREGFEFREGDIRDAGAVRSLFREHGPGGVVHLAARAGVRPSIEDPAGYADVNVRGTSVVLAEAVAGGAERFVFASSSSVYGERRDSPFRESDPVDRPVSPYAATKKAGELVCHAFHHLHGLPITCLRYFTVYGPRQRPEMAIHLFARAIEAGEPVRMFGDGTSARDYTFVSDVVEGTLRALDRADGFEVLNIGGSSPVTLAGLIEAIGAAVGREPVVTRLPAQPGDVSVTSACVDRAREVLGWSPQVDLGTGLARFVDWLRGGKA